jgi:hypothetical protein
MELLAHVTSVEAVQLVGFFLAGAAAGLSIGYAFFKKLNRPGDG